MLKIANVRVRLNSPESGYPKMIAQLLNVRPSNIQEIKLLKRSVDARRRDIHYICSFVFKYAGNEELLLKSAKGIVSVYEEDQFTIPKANSKEKVVVVGSGPAGLFCALSLAYAGMKPILIERGKSVEGRKADVQAFWKTGTLNPNSNVQFGEGGAGTFSDGKLTSNIKDKRKEYILKEFIKAGAPKEILYEAKAHIGTDYLETVVKNMRQQIIDLGGVVMFETTFVDFEEVQGKIKSITVLKNEKREQIYCDHLVLALGHSARDTYRLLNQRGIAMARKPFAVGVRVEHAQEMINFNQYKRLGLPVKAADYQLSYHDAKGRGVYTFCMCPGGYVVASSSEEGGVVTNGMSEFARDATNANSAVLVSILPEDFSGDDVFAGMDFQIELEKKAFELGGSNYFAPIQLVQDFINRKKTDHLNDLQPTYQPGTTFANLWDLFPKYVSEGIRSGLLAFEKKITGFTNEHAILTGVESRSSSPVRIIRDEQYQSNISNIYPIGEGAGAAGGIMTSAIDGIKCAQIIIADKNL